MDVNLYDRCSRESNEIERQYEYQRNSSKQMWDSIRQSSQSRGIP